MHTVPLPVVGLDVSKATLAVGYQRDAHRHQLEASTDKLGFPQRLQARGAQGLFALEATGTHCLARAGPLSEQGGQVTVLNPLVIKRFIQMHPGQGKADRKDAQGRLRYGPQQPVTAWQPGETVLAGCRQPEPATERLPKQKTMVANSLEAFGQRPVIGPIAQDRLRPTWQLRDDQARALEAELLTLLEQRFAQETKRLHSIPGSGRETAGTVPLFAGGFTRLGNYRQLVAKAGLCPREHPSGTGVRGKARITKMGGALVRGKLFVGSFSAKKSNAAGKALYERLVAKGKNGIVALIAVCNELRKQAFAIVKSGVPYQANFAKPIA